MTLIKVFYPGIVAVGVLCPTLRQMATAGSVNGNRVCMGHTKLSEKGVASS